MFNHKKEFILFYFLILFFISCSSAKLPDGKVSSTNQQVTAINTSEIAQENFTNPSIGNSLISQRYTEPIEKAWKNFTMSGQYRLAKRSELIFSDDILKKYPNNPDILYTPFVYAWGSLGYPMKKTQDHLAAIVVDTTRDSNDKYSLVIFSPPQNNSKDYNTYWLYRDKNLSNYTLSAPSGYLIVDKYLEDGTNVGCFVEWNKKLKDFQCK